MNLLVNSKASAIVNVYNEVYKTDNVFKEQIDTLVKSDNNQIITIGGSKIKEKMLWR